APCRSFSCWCLIRSAPALLTASRTQAATSLDLRLGNTVSAQWLELLKEIAPSVKRVAVLRDAAVPEVGQFGHNSSRGTVARRRREPDQRARRRRDRVRHHDIRTFLEWWPHRARKRVGGCASRQDRRPCGTEQTSSRLRHPLFCNCGRPDLLWS